MLFAKRVSVIFNIETMKSRILNSIIFIFVVWTLYLRLPTWLSLYQLENRDVYSLLQDTEHKSDPDSAATSAEIPLLTLSGEQSSIFHRESLPRKKRIIVFWATWCGPCKVELERLNNLIKSDVLKRGDVFAISSQENLKLVGETVRGRGYNFEVLVDSTGEIARRLNVTMTPTLFFIDEQGKTKWVSAGISPTLELRVRHFFSN